MKYIIEVYRIKFLLKNMTTLLKNLNKFVSVFFAENGSAELETKWMISKNQTTLKNMLSKAEKFKNKDPDAPKRGKSAYLYFCSANREKVVKDLGKDAKATDITRELGQRWNKLKNDPKRSKELHTFQKQADTDKERYQKEIKNYTPPENFVKKVKTGPKRGKSAYLFFCDANREKVVNDLGKDVKATEITRELGKRWAVLKEKKKTDEFDTLAAKDKTRYFAEKEKMQSSDTTVKKEKEPAVKPEVVDADSSKKLSGYQLFCSEKRDQYKKKNPSAKPSAVNKLLAAAWKKLTPDEQAQYKATPVAGK